MTAMRRRAKPLPPAVSHLRIVEVRAELEVYALERVLKLLRTARGVALCRPMDLPDSATVVRIREAVRAARGGLAHARHRLAHVRAGNPALPRRRKTARKH